MMKKYFEVTVKCGHVGRGKYIDKKLAISAESAKQAAKIARDTPRVKHHHKDAILFCKEITVDEYEVLKKENENDLYFQVHSIQEQKRFCPEIYENILLEKEVEKVKNRRKSIEKRLKVQAIREFEYQQQCKWYTEYC